jgi:guanylate kinase
MSSDSGSQVGGSGAGPAAPPGRRAAKGGLIVVSAPSGAGKSSLIDRVVTRVSGLEYSVSYTTREARGPERNGVDYHFVSETVFLAMREQGEFIEWARVHGHLYGTRASAIEAEMAAGRDVILDIDVQGAEQIREKMAEAVTIFVLPPSQQVLVARLSQRNLNTADDLARRLVNASNEVGKFEEFDYVIINDELERASAALESIILAERNRPPRQRQRIEPIIETFRGGVSND